jgi:hypothetical protein
MLVKPVLLVIDAGGLTVTLGGATVTGGAKSKRVDKCGC